MLTELTDYYIRAGIAATAEYFHCPHEVACRALCKDFVTPREAFVGSEYERGVLPRVLFVSLDASSVDPGRAPVQRTLAYMRFCEESGGCEPDNLHKSQHWYWTHRLAYEILLPLAAERGIASLTFREIHKYFAHTNSAKCKDAALGTNQGPALMFDNCRGFIREEVEILDPEIIITQGKRGKEAVDGLFPLVERKAHPACPEWQYEILTVRSHAVLRFTTSHQRAVGPFNREKREMYPWLVQVVQT